MKRKLIFLLLLEAIAIGGTALCAVLVGDRNKEKEGYVCVTSFYPIRLLAESVAEGVPDVLVVNLTQNHSGCIHDYTLTTKDMKLLSEADLFLINGGGMEVFLTKAAKTNKNLPIVDTSAGYAYLQGVEHHHGGEDHGEEHDGNSKAHNHAGNDNAHVWMDVDGYLLQLSRVEEAFVKMDPEHGQTYRSNAQKCREKLLALKEKYATAAALTKDFPAIAFHEGFVYTFRMLNMETLHCLSMDAETQISAGEAAEIVTECRLHDKTVLFADADYLDNVEKTFSEETGAKVWVLDPITGGKSDRFGADAYIQAMEHNLSVILEATGNQ